MPASTRRRWQRNAPLRPITAPTPRQPDVTTSTTRDDPAPRRVNAPRRRGDDKNPAIPQADAALNCQPIRGPSPTRHLTRRTGNRYARRPRNEAPMSTLERAHAVDPFAEDTLAVPTHPVELTAHRGHRSPSPVSPTTRTRSTTPAPAEVADPPRPRSGPSQPRPARFNDPVVQPRRLRTRDL